MSRSIRYVRLGIVAASVALLLPLVRPDQAAACRTTNQPTGSLSSWLGIGPMPPLMTFPLPCPEDITSSTMKDMAPPVNPAQQLSRFIESSFDNLISDIARGGGEYVTSLASLLGMPVAHHTEFADRLRELSLTQPEAGFTLDGLSSLIRQEQSKP